MNDESPQNDDWKLVPMEDFLSNNEKDKFKWDDYLKSLAEILTHWEYKPTGSRHVYLPPQNMRSRFPMVWREKLGSSRRAIVWECVAPPAIYETYKHRLAVKVLSCPAFERPVTEVLKEVRNMEDIEHCHIVLYVASYESAEKLGIIMYPPAKCNLDEYMRPISQELTEISQIELGMPRACLSLESRQKIKHLYRFFGCLSEAVRYLQATAVGTKHKDIKPANIVVDHFDSPLLTDFGIRSASQEEVDTSGYTEKTKKYACPEALDEENRNYSADIFSLGCVFLEIVTISLGVSLDDLYSYLTDAGNDIIYAMTLSKIPGWMDVLRAKHGSNNDADSEEVDAERQKMITSTINILPLIEDMMAKERERRPSAQFLCEKFSAMYLKPCRSCAWRPRDRGTPTPNQSPPVLLPNAGRDTYAESLGWVDSSFGAVTDTYKSSTRQSKSTAATSVSHIDPSKRFFNMALAENRIIEEPGPLHEKQSISQVATADDEQSIISADSIVLLTQMQREDIIRKFTHALVKDLPNKCLVSHNRNVVQVPFRVQFQALLKEYSEKVTMDAARRSRRRQASKTIRILKYEILAKCEETLGGFDTSGKGDKVYPTIIQEAEKVNLPEKTAAEKVSDWSDLLQDECIGVYDGSLRFVPMDHDYEDHIGAVSDNFDEISHSDAVSLSDTDDTAEDRDVYDYLTKHAAFFELAAKVKKLVERHYCNQMELIRHSILLSIRRPGVIKGPTSSNQRVVFHVDWDIATFLEQQYSLGLCQDLGHIITITGRIVNAQLATVYDFLKQTWPSYTFDLLQGIRSALSRYSQGSSSHCKYFLYASQRLSILATNRI